MRSVLGGTGFIFLLRVRTRQHTTPQHIPHHSTLLCTTPLYIAPHDTTPQHTLTVNQHNVLLVFQTISREAVPTSFMRILMVMSLEADSYGKLNRDLDLFSKTDDTLAIFQKQQNSAHHIVNSK